MTLTLVQDVQTGGIPPVRFEAVVDKLPADFEPMRAEARAEGYAFLDGVALIFVRIRQSSRRCTIE